MNISQLLQSNIMMSATERTSRREAFFLWKSIRRQHVVMLASALLNMVLIAVLTLGFLGGGDSDVKSPAEQTKASEKPKASAFLPGRPAKETSRQASQSDASGVFRWNMLESNDFEQYAANLRAVGCPDKTIRDILTPLIEKTYSERAKSVCRKLKFWQTKTQRDIEERMKIKDALAIHQERIELLRRIFGFEWDSKAIKEGRYDNHVSVIWDFLPGDQVERMMCICKKHADRIELMRRTGAHDKTAAISDEAGAIYRSALAEIAAQMNPSDFEESRLRAICLIDFLFNRPNMSKAGFAGEQIREIMMLMRDFFDPIEILIRMENGGDEESIRKSENVFLSKVRASVGPEKFVRYLEIHDQFYRSLSQTVADDKLPETIVLNIFDIKQWAEAEARRIRSDRTVPRNDRRKRLAELRQAAALKVGETAGPDSGGRIVKSSDVWLKKLEAP